MPATRERKRPAPATSNGELVFSVTEETRAVALELIEPRKDNPRNFAEDEDFRQLVESVRRLGVLEPILVREKPGYHGNGAPRVGGRVLPLYEIAAGERRYRAAKAAGLVEVRVTIRAMSDAQLREIRFHENATRKDLDPIEEARELKGMLDAGDAAGPTELAKRLGVSQGHVSSRLALLRLPEKWQQRVITREIPPSHARCLAPFADKPAILENIREWTEGRVWPLKNYEDRVKHAAYAATKDIKGRVYDHDHHREVPVFKPSPEQREQLGIIELADPYSKKVTERATNVALWEKLQKAHAKAWAEKHPDKFASNGHAKPKRDKSKPPTEAELAAKAKEQAKQLATKIWRFKIDWALDLIPAAVEETMDDGVLWRLFIFLAGASHAWEFSSDFAAREETLLKAMAKQGIKPKSAKHRWRSTPQILDALAELPNSGKVRETAAAFVAGCFAIEAAHKIPGGEILAAADLLGIDLAERWKTEQRGDRGRAFYELHSKDQLAVLGRELKVEVNDSLPKPKVIEQFTSSRATLAFPKSLKTTKEPA